MNKKNCLTIGKIALFALCFVLPQAAAGEFYRRRMKNLRERVRERDVYWWCDSFLKDLSSVRGERP